MAWSEDMSPEATYFLNVLIALDELGATLAGGQPGVTISHYAAVAAQNGEAWGIALCGLLDQIDPGHCARALADAHYRLKKP
jgi:hypothetical protein